MTEIAICCNRAIGNGVSELLILHILLQSIFQLEREKPAWYLMLSEREYNHLKNSNKGKYPLSIELSFIEKLCQKIVSSRRMRLDAIFAQKVNIKTAKNYEKDLFNAIKVNQ